MVTEKHLYLLLSGGLDLDVAVEKLNISGKIYATLTLDMEAPFPHITHSNLTFIEQPEVWFSIRVLKVKSNQFL
jgi:Ca2+-dependent lipid-binding protein